MMRVNRSAAVAMAAALGAAAGAHAQLVIFETEPNDSKAQATTTLGPAGGLRAYPMPGPTDSIAGVTLGDVPGGGANSPDYFDVVTGEDPDGLYCYYFEAEAAASPETSIRGLVQSFGTILSFTDVSVQTGVSTPIKNIWYGTGPSSKFYYKASGSTAGSDYQFGYRCVPYQTIPHGGGGGGDPYKRGALTINAFSFPDLDLDLWVYDAQFNPIPDYGHDEPDDQGMTRTFEPGKYYVAVTDQNLLTHLPSPPDDANRNKPVLEFPHMIASSSSRASIPTLGLNIRANGLTTSVSAAKVHPFQVLFFEFNVIDPNACSVCPADFNQDGGVDGADVDSFFFAWESGESCGDVNRDGGVDGLDVSAFFVVWEQGGC